MQIVNMQTNKGRGLSQITEKEKPFPPNREKATGKFLPFA
jgi:hypothetical protein